MWHFISADSKKHFYHYTYISWNPGLRLSHQVVVRRCLPPTTSGHTRVFLDIMSVASQRSFQCKYFVYLSIGFSNSLKWNIKYTKYMLVQFNFSILFMETCFLNWNINSCIRFHIFSSSILDFSTFVISPSSKSANLITKVFNHLFQSSIKKTFEIISFFNVLEFSSNFSFNVLEFSIIFWRFLLLLYNFP